MAGNLPTQTYELKIVFHQSNSTREKNFTKLRNWLKDQNVDSFCEGSIDNLDLFPDEVLDAQKKFEKEISCWMIYKYEKDWLLQLKKKMEKKFSTFLSCKISSFATHDWLEGWKENFKPIYTKKFIVYPPWEKIKKKKSQIPIVIEPGMAFGTGQHESTLGCLKLIEKISPQKTALDIGTGTGILAIALKKTGFEKVIGTDIDPDAILAAKNNAKRNKAKIEFKLGSFVQGKYDLIVANILAPIILQLIPKIAKVCKKDSRIIFAGILDEQKEKIIRQAKKHKWHLQEIEKINDWVSIHFSKE